MTRTSRTSASAGAIHAALNPAPASTETPADAALPTGDTLAVPPPVDRSAVLLADLAGIRRGVVVQGEGGRIGDLIDAGQAREASAADIAVAGVNIRILA